MYIRGLIPRNFAELAEAVPIEYITYQEYIACDIAKYPELNVCSIHGCGCETMHKNVGSERNNLLCVITFA